MTRSITIAAMLWILAGSAFAQNPWNDLANAERQIATEVSRIDTMLAYHDLANQIVIFYGQGTAAQADANLKGLGATFYQREVGEADLADARTRLDTTIAYYLNAVGQAAASSTAWPGGAEQQATAQRSLDAVRAAYPRFLQANLDPVLLVAQIALVNGWARGEAAVANPFAGHLQRMQQAYPDPRTRARIAASTGKLSAPDGAAVAASPLAPPAIQTAALPPPVRPPVPDEPRPLVPGTTTAAVQWLGCYADTNDFDLDGFLQRSPTNTPQACIATCAGMGFLYAGVQYGESCLCGNSFGRYGPATNCDYACTGDPGQTCGGYSTNSIYTTGVQGAFEEPPFAGEADDGPLDLADYGLEVDIDRPGWDITSFDLESADPLLCLDECQNYNGCMAFTYVKPGVQGAAARCWLKNTVPAAVPSTCCVSGQP